ncbi:MAG: hypothetical protein CMI00_01765 [Oceanospirillaceae bacterium]|nr:hypothetical protein [Oceanospirillaceae bacterium]|tara:strand:- start:3853 stop:4179 length:327 start_codon:yes stop_codon:yes gene_type:complete
MMHVFVKLLLCTAALLSVAVQAEETGGDVIRLDGVTIQGNSENPNVLFVNAWQPPPGTGRLYQGITSFNQHWLTPVSRESLARETHYSKRYVENPERESRLKDILEGE